MTNEERIADLQEKRRRIYREMWAVSEQLDAVAREIEELRITSLRDAMLAKPEPGEPFVAAECPYLTDTRRWYPR